MRPTNRSSFAAIKPGLSVLLLPAMFAIGLTPITATPASADQDCDTKEQIFAAAWNANTSYWRTGSYGTKNKILLKRRDLNSSCGSTIGRKGVWSMSHLRMGGIDGHWVEVGWTMEGGITIPEKFYWFSEWGLNYSAMGGTAASHPCPTVNEFDWWRTANEAGTNTWRLSINCNPNQYAGSWILLDSFNTGYSQGIAMGETGRRGGEATGMSEEMGELERKTNTNDWVAWDKPKCYHDNATNWQFSYVYINAYNTAQGTNNCDNRI